MGRVFLVEFDQTPHNHFYCCRICRAHIALSQDCLGRLEAFREGYFTRATNVLPGERDYMAPFTREDLYCVRCNDQLGLRAIMIPYLDGSPNELIRLKLHHLLFWNGTELLDANLPLVQLFPPAGQMPPPPQEVQQEVEEQVAGQEHLPEEEVQQEVAGQDQPPEEEVEEEVAGQDQPPEEEVQQEVAGQDQQEVAAAGQELPLPPVEVQDVVDQDLPLPPDHMD